MTPDDEVALFTTLEVLRESVINLHGILLKKGILSAEDFVSDDPNEFKDMVIMEGERGKLLMEQEEEKNDDQS